MNCCFFLFFFIFVKAALAVLNEDANRAGFSGALLCMQHPPANFDALHRLHVNYSIFFLYRFILGIHVESLLITVSCGLFNSFVCLCT
jgi:hypothetical protein